MESTSTPSTTTTGAAATGCPPIASTVIGSTPLTARNDFAIKHCLVASYSLLMASCICATVIASRPRACELPCSTCAPFRAHFKGTTPFLPWNRRRSSRIPARPQNWTRPAKNKGTGGECASDARRELGHAGSLPVCGEEDAPPIRRSASLAIACFACLLAAPASPTSDHHFLASSLPFLYSPARAASLPLLPSPSLIIVANMRWHRGQQLWLAVAAVVPGALVYKQLVKPPYAALMLVVLYFCSKRHAFLLQRQYEREEHARKTREADENHRLASLPKGKRRDAERTKKLQLDDEASASGSDHPKDE